MRIRRDKSRMVQTAFATAKVKDGDEQDFVNTLRAGQEEGIVGHGTLTTMQKRGTIILSGHGH